MTIWRLWAKKLINTILAEFGVFPSKNHDFIVFMQFLQVTFRENYKKQKIIIRYFILFFAFFSKTVGLSLIFSAEMNSACQNTLITVFLWDLEKKAVFPRIFALWRSGRLWAKKLINTISAEFDFFPSKNHDSIVFMQFCQ